MLRVDLWYLPAMKQRMAGFTVVFLMLGLAPFLCAAEVVYAGGDGSSFEKAILIKNATEETGVKAEYAYIEKHFPDHFVQGQSLEEHNGRMYDVLRVHGPSGNREVFFDITEFFGKF